MNYFLDWLQEHNVNPIFIIGLLVYLSVLLIYHVGEFIMAWTIHGKASWRSFLFSWPYLIALFLSMAEYCFGVIFFSDWKVKRFDIFMYVGGIGSLVGLIIRFTAILTAQRSFTHQIRVQKSDEHILVTHGIYKWFRHPGYFGWFVWIVFMQVLLKNPLCLIVFAIWSWLFFYNRIRAEEQLLVEFFGEKYLNYKSKTSSWIPFI